MSFQEYQNTASSVIKEEGIVPHKNSTASFLDKVKNNRRVAKNSSHSYQTSESLLSSFIKQKPVRLSKPMESEEADGGAGESSSLVMITIKDGNN